MRWKDIQWRLAYAALKLSALPLAIMPVRPAARCGRALGGLLYRLLGKWRQAGLETLTDMLPALRLDPNWTGGDATPDRIVRELFGNIGIMLAEISRLYFGNYAPLMDAVEIRGLEHYQAASARGHGIIFVTAHSGNWELMAATFGARHQPVAVVARAMPLDAINRLLEKIRYRHGNSVIYRENGVKGMLTVLKENGIVGILPDQVVKPPHGIPADFLGRPAWTSTMPVKLALKTGAAILPIFAHRAEERTVITIYPALELPTAGSEDDRIMAGTVLMNRAIGEHIVRYPAQWNWLYRRWKGEKKIRAWLAERAERTA